MRNIRVGADTDVPVRIYGASPRLILWLPGETGVVNADTRVAAQLAKLGYEVWLADLFAARFLPVVPSSLTHMPDTDVTQLIRSAARHHSHIYLLTTGHGAGLALRGAQRWQREGRGKSLAGALLLFPNLYANSPEAGEAPQYHPVARHTRLPIVIVQGALSPWYWRVDEMAQLLRRGGSRVTVKKLSGMRDRFYFREDASPAEREQGNQLPTLIVDSLNSLGTVQKRKSP